MWYIAKLIFQIKGEGMQKPQFDEHLRLVEAHNFEEAFFKARRLGVSFEESVLNKNHGLVCWEFVNVAELKLMKEFKNGTELHSQIHEIDEATHYINFVHHQAVSMQLAAKPVF
ncbi:MAG: DUF4288 domain-containing protein [Bacteroidetes bacterium]|nr:DUF4288 domain-containing protein [Bacteroidota bacterium]MBS1540804.1 DUF4288 domain-containing protein [Bacteroidota bacterium]